MKKAFYPKLALDGIRKNRRLYFPYIFTGTALVMMYYILSFLSESSALAMMAGGTTLAEVLPLGCWIIAAFSLLFMFYTNSFLIKQRYREFGLYNILGMDKKNIGKIMAWETLITAVLSIVSGLVTGILLSKAAELMLLNILKLDITYSIDLGKAALLKTPAVYCGIYALLLINSLLRVAMSKPLELLASTKSGEKAPKAPWLLAIAGVLLLAAAYYLSVSIVEPLDALTFFFFAVLLVIAGTFLIFISGSVAFCKLLQQNKNYYYKSNHFVSVSSMTYRMKRNGAGLASICILLTMVLVMVTSTSCLYFGAEDAVQARCPNSVNVSLTFDDINGIKDENLNEIRETIRQFSGSGTDLTGVTTCEVKGLIVNDGFIVDYRDYDGPKEGQIGYINVISIDDYNKIMGENKTLEADECFLYGNRVKFNCQTFTVQRSETYKVKEHLRNYKVDGETLAKIIPVIFMVVDDIYSFAAPYEDVMMYDFRCGFDVEEDEIAVSEELDSVLSELRDSAEDKKHMYYKDVFSRTEKRNDFYDMYGSLFFLGIMLSIVFLMAAVLIIYYKQICEGYEDQSRFDIMQKVGMTKSDIRKSINSQMLTVFFLPLIFAGLHLGFAFPFVSKILLMFAFSNTALSILVNIACFAAFGILYAFVYKITSGAYYAIVSGKNNHN